MVTQVVCVALHGYGLARFKRVILALLHFLQDLDRHRLAVTIYNLLSELDIFKFTL